MAHHDGAARRRPRAGRLPAVLAELTATGAALGSEAALWSRLGDLLAGAELRGAVALIDTAGELRLRALWLPPDDRAALADLLGRPPEGLTLPRGGLAGDALDGERVIASRRLAAAPGWLVAAPTVTRGRQITARLRPAAALAAPLWTGGRVAGVLIVWGAGLRAGEAALAALARQVGLLLDHLALAAAHARAVALATLAQAVTATPDLTAALRAAGEHLVRLLQADTVRIALLHGDDRTLTVIDGTRPGSWWDESTLCLLPGTPVMDALARREPRLVVAQPGEYDLPALAWEGMAARLYLPLVAAGRPVGLANAQWHAPRGPLSAGDCAFLLEAAALCGAVVERARHMAERASAQVQAEAEAALAEIAAATTDLPTILRSAANVLMTGLAAEDAAVYRLTAGGQALALGETAPQPWRAGGAGGFWLNPTVARVLATGEPALLLAASTGSRYQAWLRRHGIVAAVVAPLRAHDRTVGVAFVNWLQSPPALAASDFAFLASVTLRCALAIERIDLLAAQQRQRQRAEALAAVARAVNAGDDLMVVLTTVAEQMHRLLGCAHVSIRLLDEDGRWLRHGVLAGAHPAFEAPLPLARFPTLAAVLADGRARVVRPEDLTQPDEQAMMAALGLKACILAPIAHRARAIGLAFVCYATPVDLPEEEVDFAQALVEQCAGALARARLLAESEAARQQAARLVRAARALTASLDLAHVLEEIGQAAETLLEMERCFVYLIDQAAATARAVRLPTALKDMPEPLQISLSAHGLVPLTVQQRAPVVVNDARASTAINPNFVNRFGTRAALAAPLLAREEAIGALVVTDTRGPRQFTAADVAAVEALAALAAAAIENARLYAAERLRAEQLAALNQQLQESQAHLVQAGKLAAVGTLAAGVAHELNQPLMVIRGQAQLLLDDTLAPAARQRVERIERQTEKMMRVIDHLRTFGRRSSGTAQPVALNQVVDEALLLIGQQIRDRTIALELALAAPAPVALAEANEVEQILLNLLSNAVDALAERGGPGRIVVRTWADAAGCHLSVGDDGPGIAPEVLARIFDPFFTTKEIGKGTGLGLSISRQIARHWGGDLTVVSTPGAGATFTLSLPRGE
jgi:signal transduction histidine kinase